MDTGRPSSTSFVCQVSCSVILTMGTYLLEVGEVVRDGSAKMPVVWLVQSTYYGILGGRGSSLSWDNCVVSRHYVDDGMATAWVIVWRLLWDDTVLRVAAFMQIMRRN